MWELRRCGGRATLASKFVSMDMILDGIGGKILICDRQHTL